MVGDRAAIEDLLTFLLEQAHLGSRLRRDLRALPVHVEAVAHLRIARPRLVRTLEESLFYLDDR